MIANVLQEDFFVHSVIPPERTVNIGLPLKEIGYLDAVLVRKDLVYSDMLEITVRLASEEDFAVDYIDGVRYETPFPHVMIKKPGVHHQYRVDFPRKAFFLQYYPESLLSLQNAGVDFSSLIWKISLTQPLLECLEKILKISAWMHLPMMRANADLLGWEFLLLLLEFQNKEVRDDETFRKFQEIVVYLQTHYLKLPGISELVQSYGLSERSFFRHWKKYYPISPLEMVKRQKLEYAKTCLNSSDMQISEIAGKLNCSAIYFDRFFKRETGQTPRQYRTQSRKRAKAALS